MPFALVLIGLAMIITGAKDTHLELGKQLTADFTGEKNFTTWLVAIGAVGAVGYSKDLQPISRIFLGLIIVVMVISNGGFFAQLQSALAAGPEAIPRPSTGGATPTAIGGDQPFYQNPLGWILQHPFPQNDIGGAVSGGIQSTASRAQENFNVFIKNIVPTFAHLFGVP